MEGPTETSSKQSGDASITDIPDHILTEICARLSVKSVCRCRSVCKHWFNALTDTTFIKLHYERAPIYPLLEDRSGYVNSNSKSLYLFEIERDHDRYFDDHGNIELDTVFKLPGENPLGMDIINSCNGFLCLKGVHNTRLIVIYNPVTGEYLTLPKPFDDKQIFAFYLHGLGFCSTSNQYKVLLTATENGNCKSCVNSNSPDCRNRTALVYTLVLGGGWRNVGKVPCFYCSTNGNSVIVNGALHWLVSDRRWECNSVMAFDLEGEKFCSLALPPCITMPDLSYNVREWGMAGYRLLRLRLGVIRGQLYLVHNMDIPSAEFEQWVMKDYGVGNSWTKELLADVSAAGENGASTLHDGLCQSIDFASSWDFFFSSWSDKSIHFIANKHRKTWCLDIGETQTAYKVVAFVPSFYSLKEIAAGSSEILNVRST